MVKIINNDGVLCVESRLTVDQEVAEILKKESNKKCIENACKDYGVKHTSEVDQDGNVVSIVGKQFADNVDCNEACKMDTTHRAILDTVLEYDNNKECEQVCEDIPVELQKLIQKFGIIIVAVPKDFVV